MPARCCAWSPPGVRGSIARIRIPRWRTALAVHPGLGTAAIERIGDAIQEPARRGGLALLVTGESAVAEPRRIVALQAERIAASHRIRQLPAMPGHRVGPVPVRSEEH